MDGWRYDFFSLTKDNPYNLSTRQLGQNSWPVFASVASNYQRFKFAFYATDGNILDSHLIDNPLLKNRDASITFTTFFQNVPPIDETVVSKLKIGHFEADGRIKLLESINQELGINLTLVTYMRIGAAIGPSLNWIQAGPENGHNSVGLERFFAGFKKGSGKIRKILTRANNTGKSIRCEAFVVKILGNIGSGLIGDEVIKKIPCPVDQTEIAK